MNNMKIMISRFCEGNGIIFNMFFIYLFYLKKKKKCNTI